MLKDLIVNIFGGIIGGLIAGFILSYILAPYLDQLPKERLRRLFRSQGFVVAAVIGLLVIISILQPSTAPFIYGHGPGSYSYIMNMERFYRLIPQMIGEMKSLESPEERIDYDFLELQEELYYVSFSSGSAYSLRRASLEESKKFTGIHQVRYPNGQLFSETQYLDGNRLEDRYRAYYPNGGVRAEINLTPGRKNLFKIVKYYYADGSLWIEYRYYDEHRAFGAVYDRAGEIVESGDHVIYALLIPGYRDGEIHPTYQNVVEMDHKLSTAREESAQLLPEQH